MRSFFRLFSRQLVFSCCLLIGLGPAGAETTEQKTVGTASFQVGFWRVYDAELRSPTGSFDWQTPFELELTYARAIKEKRLIDSALSEMSRHTGQAERQFESLRQPLAACFADVQKGDKFLAQRINNDEIKFSLNSAETCRLKQADISRLFFGIWLSEDTRSDSQSLQLRGLGK